MKKRLSPILALTLAMALAVPAMAADYGKVTVNTPYGGELVFEAATTETTTVKAFENQWDADVEMIMEKLVFHNNATLITVKPGSTMQGSVDAGYYYLNGDGTYHEVIAGIHTLSGTVDDWFTLDPLTGLAPAMYQVEAPNNNYYFIVLGNDGAAPAEPEQPAATETPAVPASGTAYASTQTVELDGEKVEFQMYALKEANGGLTNYIKVRDLAFALNGTKAQFSVDWDGQVNLVAGEAYDPNGSENSTPFSGDRAYTVPTSPTKVNGEASDLSAIVLTDDNGGGYNYYKLRDLGSKLGFNVDWIAERGVFIETDKPYGG